MIIRLRLLRRFKKGDPVVRDRKDLIDEAVKKAKSKGINYVGAVPVELFVAFKVDLIWPEVVGTEKQCIEVKVEK